MTPVNSVTMNSTVMHKCRIPCQRAQPFPTALRNLDIHRVFMRTQALPNPCQETLCIAQLERRLMHHCTRKRGFIAIFCLWFMRCGVAIALPDSMPTDLQWQTNLQDPVFASSKATRGGRFRSFMLSFPLTLRRVGPDSNGGFAGYLRANQLGLVGAHPNTLKPIPELATHWAFGEDGRSIYFKLDPDARWSDGRPITAVDYLYTLTFMRSKAIVAPWYSNYYSKVIIDVRRYDDYTIAVQGATAKPPEEMLFEYAIGPTPAHFHILDDNWVRDYNWKIEPNTGPYQICEVRKGKHIEFCRKENWWGNDRRYFRHRFNVDRVRVKVIRDINIAYQYFIKGELDSFGLVMPRFWHKKAQGRPYQRGYIGKIKFYNDVPQPAAGLYLNEDDPLFSTPDVRQGFAHAMNIDKVISTVLRGDYERLQTMNEGYGDYTNRNIRARTFDLDQVEFFLNRAGWSERGADGIRQRDGERFSVRVTYTQPAHTPRLVVLKEEALKAGVELKLQLLDPSAGFKQILEKRHQAAWMGWSGGGLSPSYWQFFFSANAHIPQTNNITNTDDPHIDAAILAYRAATGREQRIALAHELEQRVHDIGSVIPTFKVPYTREGFWRWIQLPENFGTRSSTSLFAPFGTEGGLFWIDESIKEDVMSSRRSGKSFPPINIENTLWQTQ